MFDNAPDWAAVAAFVPPAGPGRVLITSRDPFLPPGLALDVPVLGKGEDGAGRLRGPRHPASRARRRRRNMRVGLPVRWLLILSFLSMGAGT